MKKDTSNTVDKIFQLPLSAFLKNVELSIFITDATDRICWINEIGMTCHFGDLEMGLLLNKSMMQGVKFFKALVKKPESYEKKMLTLLKERTPQSGITFHLADDSVFDVGYIPVFIEGSFQCAIWHIGHSPATPEGDSISGSEQKESFQLKVIEQIGFFNCIINKKGTIIQASPSFSKFVGILKDELEKKNIFDLCSFGRKGLKTEIRNIYALPFTKEKTPIELQLETRDGLQWVDCFVMENPGTKGRSNGSGLLYMRDITKEKNIQKELQYSKEIAERARATQQQFFASISHDIRTPLNAIIGMTLLMEGTALNDEQKESFKVLKSASDILLELLNNVLDFAKIETGHQEVHEREFDLYQTVKALISTFFHKLKGKPVDLTYAIDPKITYPVLGDTLILNQILMNLLTNAEKYTVSGHIHVSAQIEKTFARTVWIQFRVKDTGIGISKEDLTKTFQAFKRAEGLSPNFEGTGLGLSISRRLVELLGGELQVESVLGKGSTFYFSLPFEKTDKRIKTDTKSATSSDLLFTLKKSACVLVVEDNELNVKYLSNLLQKEKIVFDIQKDGETAWDKAQNKYYNLILMDMKLPGMSGLEVTSLIRTHQNPNRATPIILLSATQFSEIIDEAKEAGINDFLSKPFIPKQFLEILHKYLNEYIPLKDEEKEEEKPFQFNESLDTAYLNSLYSGNRKYAKRLFDIFLREINQDMSLIQEKVLSKDWEELRNLIHKIKPNFSMVGLTWVTKMIQEAQDELQSEHPDSAVLLIQKSKLELEKYLPLIQEEYDRMTPIASSGLLP